MVVTPIKTRRIGTAGQTLPELLDEYVVALPERSVLAVTSKVVSLCEGRVVPIASVDKEDLIKRESMYYLPAKYSSYGHHFTITGNTLIASAGIDESNGDEVYILWPSDPQRTADTVRDYLAARFGLRHVGVVVTDSTSYPMRLGTTGIALSHSGFVALNDYAGKPDLFGRPFALSQSNVSGGLAAAAVVAMGEGTEQTPLAVVSDIPFVAFQDRCPTAAELEALVVTKETDLFAPFVQNTGWQPGSAGKPKGK